MMINKPVKINRNDYDNIYIGSDFHYNHQRDFIWIPRGHDAFHKHDKFIEDCCDKLTEKDLLIYLGDWSLNSNDENTWSLIHRVPCPIFYIFGNHESCMSRIYKNGLKQKLSSCLDAHGNCLYDNDIRCHVFPFSIDKTTRAGEFGNYVVKNKWGVNSRTLVFFGEEETFHIGNMFYYCRHMAPAIWDKMKYDNQVCLCGHSHGNFEKINTDSSELGKILDVGVDNAIEHNGTCFFTVEEVDAIMRKKTIKIHDHHGE